MKIFKSTRRYEKWLRKELGIFEDDLVYKSQKLSEDPFSFLRGTFYRWMQLWPEVGERVAEAPVVLAVGDLHAANFGTWRDTENQLAWGINDFDEAAPLPYTLDLTRLATSVELASENAALKIRLAEACEAILDGYRLSLDSGGKPFILKNEQDWMRSLYLQRERSADTFWERLDQLSDFELELPLKARLALEATLPAPGLEYRVKHRLGGVGSLGRPRYTALASWQGERVARETKPLLPSVVLWVDRKHKGAEIYYQMILAQAVRACDPILKVYDGWVVRRIAPDSRRIELSELGPERDEARMLHAMGWETANIHLGTPSATKAILTDLKHRNKNWLRQAAERMAEATIKDWKRWRKVHPALSGHG